MQQPRKKMVLRAPLTPEHIRFVREYIFDLDPVASALRAGIRDAETAGPALLKRSTIQSAIQTLTQNRSTRTEIYADEVLRRWWLLYTADARELIQVHWVNCRFCWGVNHRYQFRDHELMELELRFNEVNDKLPREKQKAFNDQGGGGFDGDKEPCRGPLAIERMIAAGLSNVPESNSNHNCPGCDGRGEKSIWINDSRHYSPGAALLYEGVKVSKDGSIELKFRDRQHAGDMIAQHLGMLVTRTVNLDLDPTKLSDDQLDAVLRQFNHLATGETGPLLEYSPSGETEEVGGETVTE
jgi:phage terminase small subunit